MTRNLRYVIGDSLEAQGAASVIGRAAAHICGQVPGGTAALPL